ncbi:MAG: sensor histidine kinase [Clostridium sp.]
MKIWKKIFIYSFILFVVIFNVAGVMIIENIYSRNLNFAIKNSITDSKDIANTIYLNADLLDKFQGDVLWKKLRGYMYAGYSELKNIEVYDSKNGVIMDTSTLNVNNKELLDSITDNDYKFVIEESRGIHYISVGYEVNVGGQSFKIVVTNDVDHLWKAKLYNYKVFILLSLITTIVLAIGLFIISKRITNPIEDLSKISDSIKNGDYEKRSTYKSKDEIGVLAENFNSMMGVIDDNIKELRDVNNQKQRFIDNLTHEMKTPITSILGFSELLLKGNLNEEMKRKALTNINEQGKRLEHLSDSLIKLVLIRNSTIVKENLKATEVINEIYSNNLFKIRTKSIKIIKDVKIGSIFGNKELIEVLLNNIIDNGIKACNKNGVIEIAGRPVKEKNIYELRVKDNGSGIPKDELEKINEPFYMVDKARATKGKNMGLGLAICTEICRLNNIEMSFNSEVNVGTIVTLKFKMENKIYES